MPGIIEFVDVMFASNNQRLYRAAITTTEDIAELVGDRHYESLTAPCTCGPGCTCGQGSTACTNQNCTCSSCSCGPTGSCGTA